VSRKPPCSCAASHGSSGPAEALLELRGPAAFGSTELWRLRMCRAPWHNCDPVRHEWALPVPTPAVIRAVGVDELIAPMLSGSPRLNASRSTWRKPIADGCTNAARLWAEIHARGYRGHRCTVRRCLNRLANGAVVRKRPRRVSPPGRYANASCAPLIGRTRAVVTTSRPNARAARSSQPLPSLPTPLARLLRERRGRQLGAWVQAAEIAELRAFCRWFLRKD
jgi:hypothetical protein